MPPAFGQFSAAGQPGDFCEKNMDKYTFAEWVFIFCIYSMIGFIWETVYCSVRERKLVNRGFMKGPFLPIYGFGVCTMLVAASPFEDHVILACLSGMICATVLEYVTGDLMEHLFKVRYWDYSAEKFNLNGYICLGASLGWCAATFVVNEILQKPVNSLIGIIDPSDLKVIDIVIMVIAVVDFAISFKAAMDLRMMLVKIEKARHEMKLMQKRLDVVIAVLADEAGERYEDLKEDISEKLEKIGDIGDGVSDRFDDFGRDVKRRLDYVRKNFAGVSDKIIPDSGRKVMDEVRSLGEKYASVIRQHASFTTLKGTIKNLFVRNIIRSNPTITSNDYREALEELKKASKDGHDIGD